MTTSNNNTRSHGKQGFASMDANKQREIAAKGGRASHSGGNSTGGNSSSHSKSNTSSGTMAERGRKGGKHSHGGRGKSQDDDE